MSRSLFNSMILPDNLVETLLAILACDAMEAREVVK